MLVAIALVDARVIETRNRLGGSAWARTRLTVFVIAIVAALCAALIALVWCSLVVVFLLICDIILIGAYAPREAHGRGPRPGQVDDGGREHTGGSSGSDRGESGDPVATPPPAAGGHGTTDAARGTTDAGRGTTAGDGGTDAARGTTAGDGGTDAARGTTGAGRGTTDSTDRPQGCGGSFAEASVNRSGGAGASSGAGTRGEAANGTVRWRGALGSASAGLSRSFGTADGPTDP